MIEQTALYSSELAKSLPALLQQGRVLLLLDALNEVPQLKRDKETNAVNDPRATEIASFAEEYSHCQMVLTCRVKEFDGIPGWHYLHVLDLNREQVSEFVGVFFEGVGDGTAQGQKLLTELYESQDERKQKLQGLTRQPFYLMRLLVYYYETGDVPANPALLLKFSVDEALEREFTRRVVAHELTEEAARQERVKLESALALLAFNMTEAEQVGAVEQSRMAAWLFHLRDKQSYTQSMGLEHYPERQAEPSEQAQAGAMVKQAQRAGLLVQTGGQFGFYHQLMQEYFCACYCFSHKLDQMWLFRTSDSSFAEVWRLWGGLDPAFVTKLMVYLKDPDYGVRLSAADALGMLGDSRAVLPLVEALHPPDRYMRLRAARALARLGDSRAVLPLIEALHNPDGRARYSAADALGRLGEPAVISLIEILHDSESYGRDGAACALGMLGDSRAVIPLIEALHDPESQVRLSAADALGRLGDSRVVMPLIEALHDLAPDVCYSAANALVSMGEPAIMPLIEALDDSDNLVRSIVVSALGILGDSRALPELERIAREDEGVTGRGDRVADRAKWAIEEIKRQAEAKKAGR